MKTLTYYIEANEALDWALETMTEKIPCFANWKPMENDADYIEVTVTCREEDTAFVEKLLAPFV